MIHRSDALPRWFLPLLLLAWVGPGLRAQEVSMVAGRMSSDDGRHSSYTYQADYRQDFYRNLAASVAYLNEGHVPGHHRDGVALEAWVRLPFDLNRFSVALGAGGYGYDDTQNLPAGGSADVHGTAPIFSASGTGYLSDRWFYRATLNHIAPAGAMKVNTASLGIGFWFGQAQKPIPGRLGDTPSERSYATVQEITVFGGQSVVNTFFSPKGGAFAAEYRRGLDRHIDWTVSLIYEGNPLIVRRSGAATQGWAVNSFFDDRVTVGIGVGPYFYIDSKHPPEAGSRNPAAIAGLGSLSLTEKLSRHLVAHLLFDRVLSNYDRDADIFLLGLGYRWP